MSIIRSRTKIEIYYITAIVDFAFENYSHTTILKFQPSNSRTINGFQLGRDFDFLFYRVDIECI